jgi:hypothetical protein
LLIQRRQAKDMLRSERVHIGRSATFSVFMKAVFFSNPVWTPIKFAPRQDHPLLLGVLLTAVAALLGRHGIV